MRKLSVVIQQLFMIAVALVLPSVLLFSCYTNRFTALTIQERENSAQSTLEYVHQTFELLADTSSAEAVRISSSEDYITAISDFMHYDQVMQDMDLQEDIQDVAKRLATVQFADQRLRNIYLYTLGTDYVITSDRGLLRFNDLSDAAWLDSYLTHTGQTNALRRPIWMGRTTPETDLLSNGSHDNQTPVISYVLPVRIANSRSLSLLIMNYYETKIAELINIGKENLVYIVDGNGTVICHPQLSALGTNVKEKAYLAAVLDGKEESGAHYEKTRKWFSLFNSEMVLFSWLRIDVGDWVLVNENRLHTFTVQTMNATRSYLLAFMALLVCGSMICLHATRRAIAPIAQLSKTLQPEDGSVRNEVLLIEGEIQRLHKREQELMDSMQRSNSDAKNLYLLSLLRDTHWDKEIPLAWREHGFGVVVLEADTVSGERLSSTTLYAEARKAFENSRLRYESLVLDGHTCVFILNLPQTAESLWYDQAAQILDGLRKNLQQHTQLPFTAGVGLYQEGESGIYDSYRQAIGACRQRMLRGRGQTILYEEKMTGTRLYGYSKKSETMLLNALAAANEQAVDDAIAHLRGKLLELSADNILQTMNQLTGVIAAWLMENYVIDDIFEGGLQAWYAEESAAETLDELLHLLRRRAMMIIAYLEEEKAEFSHIDRIIGYISEHYMEDPDFEKMAEDIGISYSHARRVVKLKKNQTLLDLVHETRIGQAKQLMAREPALSIKEIAARVGYHNIQSFNRFFKKFECITPSEWRNNQN